MRAALDETPAAGDDLYARLEGIEARLAGIAARLQGDPAPGRLNEPSAPSILGRIGQVAGGHWGTRQPPTETQRGSLEIARGGFERVSVALGALLEEALPALEADLEAAGAPWTPGRRVGLKRGDMSEFFEGTHDLPSSFRSLRTSASGRVGSRRIRFRSSLSSRFSK